MLTKSAQNQSISSESCPENFHEIFYGLFFGEISPENFRESVSENPVKFDFSTTNQKPCSMVRSIKFDCLKISPTSV